MPFTRQEANRRRLQMCANRLAKLIELGAPARVIGSEIGIILRCALSLHPEEVGAAVGHILGQTARVFYGMCAKCGADHDRGRELECPACQLRDEMEFGDEYEENKPPEP